MPKYKVVPTCLRTQNQAPAVLVDADENSIDDVALKTSRLFEMEPTEKGNWVPSITKLKGKPRK